MKILLKNVVLPADNEATTTADVLIEQERIARIAGQITDEPADKTIDGRGGYLSPGWVDMRAHFGEPGQEHLESLQSGCKAAAAGGFTEVALMPNTQPAIDGKEAIRFILSGNEERLVKLHALGAVTKDAAGEELAELLDMQAAGALAFTDGHKPLTNSGLVVRVLKYLQKDNTLFMNRAEEPQLAQHGQMHEGIISTLMGMRGIPTLSETMGLERDLSLLRYAGGRLHISCLSSAAGVALVRKAKQEGLQLTADVAAHQLTFTDEALQSFDTLLKVNPPFRTEEDRQALLEGLIDGTIDAVVSDHQPHDTENKRLEFDLASFGTLGLQTVLPCLLQAGLSPNMIIDKLALAPRRILGLSEIKLEEGAPANCTLFHPEEKWVYAKKTNYSRSDNSPFLGQKLTGKVLAVLRNSQFWLNEQ